VLNVLGAGSSMLAASFPEDVQSDVWDGEPEALLCNVLFPAGSASGVSGGYRLSGRFPYASGCDLAQWALLGSRISGREIPPHAISWGMLVPMSELAVIDDWDVLGLVGTGSKTLVANDVFVPSAHVVPIENPTGTTGPYAFSTVAAGIARGAVARFVAYVAERGSIGGGWSAASEAMQAKVSESAAEADAAWALILRDCAAGSEPLTPVLRARNRRNAAYAMRLAHAAVERLFLTCGGSAAYRSSLIQQSFRDVHTAALHFSAHWDSAAIASGRVLLELGGDVVF
jgi:alkylation response protein AidB-like acyl-CoA dehydrogenase